MIKNILVSSRLNEELKDNIKADCHITYCEEEALSDSSFADVDAFIGFSLPENINAGKLKWIHCLGAGVDGILSNKSIGSSAIVTRTTGNFGQKIAEYVLCRVLAESQRYEFYKSNQSSGVWLREPPTSISEENILVFGTGQIGSAIGSVLKQLGARVYGISRRGEQNSSFNDVYKAPDEVPDLNSISWIVNTMPLTEETLNYFNYDLFKRFNNINFVNVGRGRSVSIEDIQKAVKSGNVAKAFLDVFDHEPLDGSSDLWCSPGIYITPHISAFTDIREAINSINDTYYRIMNSLKLDNLVTLSLGY